MWWLPEGDSGDNTGGFSGTLNGSLKDERLLLSAFSSAARELLRGSGSETMRCLDVLRESLGKKALPGADLGLSEGCASLKEVLGRIYAVIVFSGTRQLLAFGEGPSDLIGRWAA